MFASVLMRPCVYRSLRAALPHLARTDSPVQTVPSSETQRARVVPVHAPEKT